MNSKGAVRTQMRRLREGLAPADREERSRRIAERLRRLEAFWRARRVLFYAADGGEVETLPLLERWIEGGRKVILPRVEGETMILVEVDGLKDLAPGYGGLLEPRSDRGRVVPWEEVEVALVPGLAFDLEGNRLGRGGGHYDRTLACIGPKVLKIGLAFDFQVVDRLPVEARDVPVDCVVTESRMIEAGGGRAGPPRNS
ncbi:MAG TPA: 5-formyltetrahydrofolate cyclo-ligase [Candidatus Methylomirabilis sp.]|nr:5-formyltetrahydrofolate cyclo-ligase [Candidatus Methylomirabilis sp.]